MFAINFVFMALFLQIFENTQSRVITYEEVPISAGDLIVKFMANKDTTGDIGKLVIILREDEDIDRETKSKLPKPASSFIPDLNLRDAIEVIKCPTDWKRIGPRCVDPEKYKYLKRRRGFTKNTV